jgi:hypothetical protein
MLAGKTQKTKTCPYCGKKVNVISAVKVASAPSAIQASEMLKILKTKQASTNKP